MPNDTTPLLPPDPEKPGRYWMTRTGWNIGERVEIWEWSPAEPLWRHEQWGPMSPDLAGKAGYTLATRHRIPTPGELEAVYALADTLRDLANDAVIPHQGAHIVGQETFSAAGARVKALREAAAMLRAALGGGA